MGLLDKIWKKAKPQALREARQMGIPTSEQQAVNRVRNEVRDETRKDKA